MGRCREITYVVDLFIAHVAGMDTLAHSLHNATRLIEVFFVLYYILRLLLVLIDIYLD
ncbi:putative xylose isomerase [Helianthus annuus]|nr:putative xylose isomerase [Helianthus annuus]